MTLSGGAPSPSVSDLGVPRVVVHGDTFKDAIKQPPPGMFLVNVDHDWIEQWVMDHWEVVGQYVRGNADDPLGNAQIAAGRSAGIAAGLGGAAGGAAGGGGTAPAPRPPGSPSVTDPSFPFPNECSTIFQDADPGAIGPGRFWFDTGSTQLFIRNNTNTVWIEICLV